MSGESGVTFCTMLLGGCRAGGTGEVACVGWEQFVNGGSLELWLVGEATSSDGFCGLAPPQFPTLLNERSSSFSFTSLCVR